MFKMYGLVDLRSRPVYAEGSVTFQYSHSTGVSHLGYTSLAFVLWSQMFHTQFFSELIEFNCHITLVLMPWPISMPPCEMATVPSCWYMVTCTPYPQSESSGISYLTGSIDKPFFFHRLSCCRETQQVKYLLSF